MIEDLQKLQDHVAPFPTKEAHRVIREEFGKDTNELFSEFSPSPLASGSIAQTYRARTHDGKKVVVKIRRPGIEHTIKLDMFIMERIAENIEKHIPELRYYRPKMIVDEFNQTLHREMDLLNEGTVTDRICKFLADDKDVVVPSIVWNLTSSRILTMTYIEGKKFHEVLAEGSLAVDREKLARKLIDCFMMQFFDLGLFHGDPHPGNLMILPSERWGLIDFGMSGQIDHDRRSDLIMLLAAGSYRQWDMVMDILSDMNSLTESTDTELLKRDLVLLIDKYQALPLRKMNLQVIFSEMVRLAREHHVILPRDLVLVGRSLVLVGGVAMMLDPEMNLADVIRPKVRSAIVNLFGRENVTREMLMVFWHSGLLLKDFPRYARELSRKLLRGQLKIQYDVPHIEALTRELDRSSNRLSFSLVIGSIIIGSSLVFHAKIGPFWAGMPLLGLTGYFVAGIMGLWLAIAIIRSGKLS